MSASTIRELTAQERVEQSAVQAFCDCLSQDFGPVYADPEGNYYVELDSKWMQWKFVALLDERP